MQTIGEKIAELRKELNMTQEQLANVIGVSSQAISKWENNITMPDIMLLPLIANVFNVKVDDLFSIKEIKKDVDIEDIPFNIYKNILKDMWCFNKDCDSERLLNELNEDKSTSTGLISGKLGAIYANSNLALVYVGNDTYSNDLLNDKEVIGFLKDIASEDTFKIMKYQLENSGISYTISAISKQCNIEEIKAKNAIEKLVKYNLTIEKTLDLGNNEIVKIYQHNSYHRLKLLIYPLLSLAKSLSNFKENWYGFRN